jgi:hypothetical protein
MCDNYPMQNTRRGMAMQALPPSRPIPQLVKFQAPNNANLYQNLVNQTPEQELQLDRDRLMPGTWRGVQNVVDDQSDFAKHTVTPDGYRSYLATSGSARFGIIGRNPIGRLGMRNLLRSNAPVNVGAQSDILWGDSEERRSLSEGFGCATY